MSESRPKRKVEMIESYWTGGKYGSDYVWNDNHGELIRCKDCKHWYADADTGMACEFTNMGQPEDGYCNWGERREP
jgi:hypothetical protein